MLAVMTEVTQLLSAVGAGDRAAGEKLLPLVYDELRRLAAARLAREAPGHTLQATALVHEAYLRLVRPKAEDRAEPSGELVADRPGASPLSQAEVEGIVPNTNIWDSRGHFYASAAEAMRRILVDEARRKRASKRGGGLHRQTLLIDAIPAAAPAEELLAVHEALDALVAARPEAGQLVKLRYFAGFTIPETAELMGISPRKANQVWAYARAWLAAKIKEDAQ